MLSCPGFDKFPLGAAAPEDASEDGSAVPLPNLSNRLNPNNLHYDSDLAERYRRMSKGEKEALWAADRLLGGPNGEFDPVLQVCLPAASVDLNLLI